MKWDPFRVAKASACDTEFMTLFWRWPHAEVVVADPGAEARGQWAGPCAACGLAFCEH